MRTSIALGILWVGTAAVLSACSDQGTDQSAPTAPPVVKPAAPPPDQPRGANQPVAPAVFDPAPPAVGAATQARPPDTALTTPLAPDDTAGEWANELHAAKDQALRSQGVAGIWAQWDDILSRGNQREIGILLAALGDALRAPGADAVYDAIAARLADPKTHPDEANSLVAVLQQAATPKSLGMLLDSLNRAPAPSADGTPDGALVQHTRAALGAITSRANGRGPNWALSPVLEDAWKALTPTSGIEDQLTIAQGLAAVGAPSGVTALLNRATDPAADPLARQIAYDALARVTSLDTLPVLREALGQTNQDPRLRDAVWNGLISIGAADAVNVLLNELASAPRLSDDQFGQLSAAMTSRGLPDESVKVVTDALRGGQVQDERLRTLLTTLTQAPAAPAAGAQAGASGVVAGGGSGKQGG